MSTLGAVLLGWVRNSRNEWVETSLVRFLEAKDKCVYSYEIALDYSAKNVVYNLYIMEDRKFKGVKNGMPTNALRVDFDTRDSAHMELVSKRFVNFLEERKSKVKLIYEVKCSNLKSDVNVERIEVQ